MPNVACLPALLRLASVRHHVRAPVDEEFDHSAAPVDEEDAVSEQRIEEALGRPCTWT